MTTKVSKIYYTKQPVEKYIRYNLIKLTHMFVTYSTYRIHRKNKINNYW